MHNELAGIPFGAPTQQLETEISENSKSDYVFYHLNASNCIKLLVIEMKTNESLSMHHEWRGQECFINILRNTLGADFTLKEVKYTWRKACVEIARRLDPTVITLHHMATSMKAEDWVLRCLLLHVATQRGNHDAKNFVLSLDGQHFLCLVQDQLEFMQYHTKNGQILKVFPRKRKQQEGNYDMA